MENMKSNSPSPIMRPFDTQKSNPSKGKSTIIASAIVVLLGLGSGFYLSKTSSGATTSERPLSQEVVRSETEAGIIDESVLDEAESPIGLLQEGGIEGEGTHHLERPGGKSQSVYLTSTVIDLDSFVGKKVQVWGETLSGIKAGWLMDVVKVKVVD